MSNKPVNYFKLDQVVTGERSTSSLSVDESRHLAAYKNQLNQLAVPKSSTPLFANWVKSASSLKFVSIYFAAVGLITTGLLFPNLVTNLTQKPAAKVPSQISTEFAVTLKKLETQKMHGSILNIEISAPRNGSFFAAIVDKKGELIFPDSLEDQAQLVFLPKWTIPAMIFSKSNNDHFTVFISNRSINQDDIRKHSKANSSMRIESSGDWLEIHNLRSSP